MAYVMIWDPYERLLWGVAIAFAFLCGLLYFNKGRHRENFNERIIIYGFSSLLIFFALSRVSFYLLEFHLVGRYKNNIFYGDYSNFSSSIGEILYRLVFIFITIYLLSFLFSFEIIIKRTRYIFTIIYVILLVVIIISPIALARNIFNYLVYPATGLFIPLILYFYTRGSRVKFKAVSAFLTFGIILMMIGDAMSARVSKELNVYPLVIGPLIFIFGCVFLVMPLITDPEKILQAITYWIIFGIPYVILLFAFAIINFLSGYPFAFSVLLLIIALFNASLVILTIRHIKFVIIEEYPEEKKEKKLDVLGAFTRPQKVTEEEVSISKEKKICLVCKGKVGRINYLCPECSAFYCEKCSTALSDLENACWVCDTPFDEGKPSNSFKREEIEEIEVEKKMKG